MNPIKDYQTRVLLVDDQELYIRLVELVFRKKFNITTVNSEREGFAKIVIGFTTLGL